MSDGPNRSVYELKHNIWLYCYYNDTTENGMMYYCIYKLQYLYCIDIYRYLTNERPDRNVTCD